MVILIGKADVAEFDQGATGVIVDCRLSIADLRPKSKIGYRKSPTSAHGVCDCHRRVEQLEDALGARHGRLQDVVLVAQILDGAEEALRVLNEGNRRAYGDRAVEGHA